MKTFWFEKSFGLKKNLDGDRPRNGDCPTDGDRPRDGDSPRDSDCPTLDDLIFVSKVNIPNLSILPCLEGLKVTYGRKGCNWMVTVLGMATVLP